jgi:subtilase family serine protease
MTRAQLLFATTAFGLAAALAPAVRAAPTVAAATDLGPSNPALDITITVELKLPRQALFDHVVNALYDPASPSFHRWLTPDDVLQFAPPQSQIQAVRAALEREGLSILAVEPNGFSIRAHGTIATVARAFHTQLHDFTRNGTGFRAPLAPVALAGPAGAYIARVAGVESHTIRPMLVRAIDRSTGQAYAPIALSKVLAAGGLQSVITDQILGAPASFTYTTPGAPLPVASYGGVVYNPTAPLVPDYTAAQLQEAYHLIPAYQQGLAGQGQTIVLLEGFGYPTIQDDANAYSKLNNLPQLTAANFSIIYPDGGKHILPYIGDYAGWNGEIALDVQSSHSIAPAAKILVVAARGQGDEAFENAMRYIIDHHLGNVVSDSWEDDLDLLASPVDQDEFENILKLAAAQGISFQFSSGDGGDEGVGSPIGSAGVPSVEPHATAVGGTAILNKIGEAGYVHVGWGDVLGSVAKSTGPVKPKPLFFGGGGGGESVYWPKPAWQSALPGSGRQTPDISALSDPFTGFPIVLTVKGVQSVYPGVGGTSLGSPIFTAIWAIANQKAGHPLGQAAPTIAGLTTGVTDVVPVTSAQNVSGMITTAAGTIDESTQALFGAFVPDDQGYLAAITNQPDYAASFVIAFELDSSLNVTAGWDNATGYGTPDGLAFIDAAAAYK